jgi:probable rRNA maturation factor
MVPDPRKRLLVELEVIPESELWNSLDGVDHVIERAVSAVAEEFCDELHHQPAMNVLLCDDARIRELNRQFRSIDKPTNVLSFPAPPMKIGTTTVLGDVAISFETVAREAFEEKKSLAAHTTHMAIHGMLHLLGYDHDTVQEAEAMEGIERRILARLGFADPYAGSIPKQECDDKQ